MGTFTLDIWLTSVWSKKFINGLCTYFYHPQRSCGKVIYVYTCLSFCSRGICPSACWDIYPRADTPLGQTTPWADTLLGRHPSLGKHPLPGQTPPSWADTPRVDTHFLGRHPPWADTPRKTPPWADTSATSRRLLLQMARILLECILVQNCVH